MTRGGRVNPGAVMWARADLRRRWRSIVVLGLLAGLSAGLCLASLAGARRSATAFPRLRNLTHSADAVVFATQAGVVDPDWRALSSQPYVEQVARWNLLFGNLDGEPGNLLFAPSDGVWLGKVDRPLVVDGRMFDRNKPDEVVIDEGARAYGLHVGSTFRFKFYAPPHSDLEGKPPTGSEIRFRVVGVIRETSELLFTGGQIIPSPALLQQHGKEITAYENAHVRLKDWRTGMAQLKRDTSRLVGPGVPVLDLHQVETRVSTSIAVERTALLLLAAAVAAAGLVFVGQALARSAGLIEGDAEALRALGFTRRDVVSAATIPHLVVAAVAAVVAVGTATALSPRFPIGYGRRVDPSLGVHFDSLVLLPGTVLTIVLVIAGSALVAARVGRPEEIGRARRSRFLDGLRSVVPVPVGLGISIAFGGGRASRRVGARSALVGAIIGVLGLAGTLTVVHGLDDALAHPERAGVTWDAGVTAEPGSVLDFGSPDLLNHALVGRVAASRGVAAVSAQWRVVLEANGVGVPSFATVAERGTIDLVTVAGRAPSAVDEVAIGPATARQLGVDIGDSLTVARHRLRIVGRALFPPDVHSGFDEGLLLTWPALHKLAPAPNIKTGEGPFPYLAVRWQNGIEPAVGLADLERAVDDPSAMVGPAEIPPELTNLRSVRRVPLALAAFLLFIAVATLTHSLITTLRSRRSEFAVLRAVGFTRRMVAVVIAAQSSAVGAIGLLVGLPAGLVAGRLIWVWLAERVPLVYVSPIVIGLTLALIPLTVILVNLVAAWPARRAGRLKVADLLRAE